MLHPVSSYIFDAPENTAEARHRAWTFDVVFIGASPKAMDNEVAAFPEACLKEHRAGIRFPMALFASCLRIPISLTYWKADFQDLRFT